MYEQDRSVAYLAGPISKRPVTYREDLVRMEGSVLTSLKEIKRFYLQGMFV